VDDRNRFLVNWDDSYSVGVQEIDQQHRFLILRIRDLQEAMVAGSTGAILAPFIHDLVTYTHYHFAYEGRLYASRGYPDIQRHLELHAEMSRQVTRLGTALKENRLRAGTPVMVFLQRWLVDHILGEDMVAFGIKAPAQQEHKS
jgi:hemerythrin-like metal-binding protein